MRNIQRSITLFGTVCLVGAICFGLSACGNGKINKPTTNAKSTTATTEMIEVASTTHSETEQAEQTENNKSEGTMQTATDFETSKLLAYYKKHFSGNTYMMKQTEKIYEKDKVVDTIDMTVAAKDNVLASIIKSNTEDQRILIADGKAKIIRDNDKKYFEMDQPKDMREVTGEASDFIIDGIDDHADMTFSNGEKDFEGQSYYFENFSSKDVDLTYYFKDDELIYVEQIYSRISRSVSKVEEVSGEVDPAWFELPDDYRKSLLPF